MRNHLLSPRAASADVVLGVSVDGQGDSRARGAVSDGMVPGRHKLEPDVALNRGAERRRGLSSFWGHAVRECRNEPDLNQESRLELIGACVLIALVMLTVTTELPLTWLARLAEALR